MNPAELANIASLEDSFWWYSGMHRILFALLDPYFAALRPGKILEAGCGTGFIARRLEQRYGSTVYPTDIAGQALEYACKTGAKRAVQSDIASLPYASEAFDAAVSLDVLVHLPSGAEAWAVAEFARVLKTNGILVLRVAALDILRSRHSQFIREFQRFTRGRLAKLLTRHRFEVLRCTYANALLMPLATAKFRIWEPLLRRPPKSGVEAASPLLNSLLEQVLRFEASWLAAGCNFPIGQSLIVIARKT